MDAIQSVSVVAVVVAVVVGVLALRDRRGPALSVAVLLLLTAVWTSLGVAQGLADDLATKTAISRTIMVLAGALAGTVLWHAVVLAGRATWRSAPRLALLAVEPLVVAGLAVLDARTGWIVSDSHVVGRVFYPAFGPVGWAIAVYSFALVAWAARWVVIARRAALPAHRFRFTIALAAWGIPAVGALLSLALMAELGAMDLLGASSVIAASVWWWAVGRGRAAASAPISLGQVIAALGDAIVVLDSEGRVVEANAAAQAMEATVRGGSARPLGSKGWGMHWTALVPPFASAAISRGEEIIGCCERWIEVRSTPLVANGRRNGTVVVLRDVTEAEHARALLTEKATTDGLTGLRNRLHFDEVAGAMIAGARARGRPLVAMMVDVDRFKAVNDTYGHAVGDLVLQAVARELLTGTRAGDVWVRYGGEEFVGLLPGAAATEVAVRAEGLRQRVKELAVSSDVGPVPVTVSIGLVELLPDENLDSLLRRVDIALYGAKAGGRDRVTVAV